MQNSLTALTDELFHNMLEIKKLVQIYCKAPTKDHTVDSMLQYEALTFISHHPKVTMNEIANALRISLSSCTQLVDRMIKHELLKRSDDEHDRRVIRIAMTEAGKTHVEEFHTKMREKLMTVFSQLPEQDLRELVRIQGTLLEILYKLEKKQ